MKQRLSLILSLIVVGFAAAFFRPAEPHQAPAAIEISRGGFIFEAKEGLFDDEGLDNPSVQADENINPARKCGFCMGVSTSILLLTFASWRVRNTDGSTHSLLHSFLALFDILQSLSEKKLLHFIWNFLCSSDISLFVFMNNNIS